MLVVWQYTQRYQNIQDGFYNKSNIETRVFGGREIRIMEHLKSAFQNVQSPSVVFVRT